MTFESKNAVDKTFTNYGLYDVLMIPYINENVTIIIFDSKGKPIWYEKAKNEDKILLFIEINKDFHNIYKVIENTEKQMLFMRSELPKEFFVLIESIDTIEIEEIID